MLTKKHFCQAAEMIAAEPRNHAGLAIFACKVLRHFGPNFNESLFRRYLAKCLHEKGLDFAAFAVMPEPTNDKQPPEWDDKVKCWVGEPEEQQLSLEEKP